MRVKGGYSLGSVTYSVDAMEHSCRIEGGGRDKIYAAKQNQSGAEPQPWGS